VGDLLQALGSGTMQLYVVLEGKEILAGLALRVAEYPKMRVLDCVFLAGHRGLEWGEIVLDFVDRVAVATGCSKVEFKGRKEWARVLAPYGYEPTFVSYEKAVQPCLSTGASNFGVMETQPPPS
jgi:hypothetical protein